MSTRGCGLLPLRSAMKPPMPRSNGRPTLGAGPSICSSCDASGSCSGSRNPPCPPARGRCSPFAVRAVPRAHPLATLACATDGGGGGSPCRAAQESVPDECSRPHALVPGRGKPPETVSRMRSCCRRSGPRFRRDDGARRRPDQVALTEALSAFTRRSAGVGVSLVCQLSSSSGSSGSRSASSVRAPGNSRIAITVSSSANIPSSAENADG